MGKNYLMKKSFNLLTVLFFLISAQLVQAQNPVPFQPSLTGDLEQYHIGAFGNQLFVFDPTMDMRQIQTLIDILWKRFLPGQRPSTSYANTISRRV